MTWPLRRRARASRRRWPALILAVAASLLAASLWHSSAALASPSRNHRTVLTLSVAPRAHHPAQLTLVSHLQRSSGDMGGKTVAFFVVSTEFKTPIDVPIGTAETTADGSARLDYVPTVFQRPRPDHSPPPPTPPGRSPPSAASSST
jgi:hypothetical protein